MWEFTKTIILFIKQLLVQSCFFVPTKKADSAKGYFLEHTFEKNRELLFSKPAGLCISTRNDALLSRNGNNRVDFFQETGIIDMNLLWTCTKDSLKDGQNAVFEKVTKKPPNFNRSFTGLWYDWYNKFIHERIVDSGAAQLRHLRVPDAAIITRRPARSAYQFFVN